MLPLLKTILIICIDPDLAIYADWLLPIFQSDLNMDPDGSITNRDIRATNSNIPS